MLKKKSASSAFIIILLILAGEAVFVLPFVLARIFRPTFLEVFAINNTQLGSCFSVYGAVALISYLFGGPLADKFKPSKLMAVALMLTAFGGFYLASYPSLIMLHILYGFWGFTTIFLFWAAMIKATRIWGGNNHQGLAFGFLDGGRGLTAALFGSLGVLLFSVFITSDIAETSLLERQKAFKMVIIVTSSIVCFIAFLVYFFLKNKGYSETASNSTQNLTWRNFKTVMAYPSVWLLMIIILCAYFGYKMTDVFSLYAKDVMLYNDIDSAQVGTYLLYMRPIIGVVIGLLADKTRASLWIVIGFLAMLITSLIFSTSMINSHTTMLFVLSIIIMAIGVYSARVLYFATLNEAKIPVALTGTAVGFISVVGYTPDIFAGPIIGYFLDASPGALGHRHVFMIMAVVSLIGLIASYAFYKISTRKNA
ncbi:MFS transporter [Bizionia argentinensis JUB59]|uniref:MFS transporter n=1 Tax=Bizionia argentinensis JUB59 TaxID=1046627 RepID=G2E9V0_9FLAO|nr:MFS transporter [Bizionia argentinensis]EGV44933.1 MFS transporter [Bizionia argentinensis JUB59]